jgi:two-component sensor histidine kinase
MTEPATMSEALEQIALLEQQNIRLRRLLDTKNAPQELRHRLRETLGLLRSVIRGTASSRSDVGDYVAHLEDRLDALSRAQSMADTHGAVDIQTLLGDLMLSYGMMDGGRVSLQGSQVLVAPRIGQTLALALHELTVNSIEHGALGGATGSVVVSWKLTEQVLHLDWDEKGPSISPTDRQGFGSDYITAALAYQIHAKVRYAIELGCVRCSMAIPLA